VLSKTRRRIKRLAPYNNVQLELLKISKNSVALAIKMFGLLARISHMRVQKRLNV
jgi:hypothetical protein